VSTATIAGVQSPARPTPHPRAHPFLFDALVILPLANPRRKRKSGGRRITELELSSFDDPIALGVRDSKPLYPGVGFSRTPGVEPMQLDPSDSRRPSLADRFAARVLVDPFPFLSRLGAAQLVFRVRL
jgi:hypothetical protein